jgi:hypothetical protein
MQLPQYVCSVILKLIIMIIKLIVILAFSSVIANAQDSLRFEKRKLMILVGLFIQENTAI